jgi:hypothetical protein
MRLIYGKKKGKSGTTQRRQICKELMLKQANEKGLGVMSKATLRNDFLTILGVRHKEKELSMGVV